MQRSPEKKIRWFTCDSIGERCNETIEKALINMINNIPEGKGDKG